MLSLESIDASRRLEEPDLRLGHPLTPPVLGSKTLGSAVAMYVHVCMYLYIYMYVVRMMIIINTSYFIMMIIIKGLRPLPPTPGRVAWIYSRRHTSMQRMHSLCLRLPSCSSHESTPGPLAPTRNPPPSRSNPRGRSQEIQEIHEARQTSTRAEAPKTDTAHSSNQQLAVGPDTVTPQLYTYICPHCAKSVQSKVATGQIDHRRGDGCGHKFRVANGLLAGRTHTHTCPTCSAVVHSTKASAEFK